MITISKWEEIIPLYYYQRTFQETNKPERLQCVRTVLENSVHKGWICGTWGEDSLPVTSHHNSEGDAFLQANKALTMLWLDGKPPWFI